MFLLELVSCVCAVSSIPNPRNETMVTQKEGVTKRTIHKQTSPCSQELEFLQLLEEDETMTKRTLLPLLLTAALACMMLAVPAFAAEHQPGQQIVQAQVLHPNMEIKKADTASPPAMLAAGGCNENCHQSKDSGTTAPVSQAAVEQHLGFALTGPPDMAVAQQKTYDVLVASAAEGTKQPGLMTAEAIPPDRVSMKDTYKGGSSPGLVASGTDSFDKNAMYSDSNGMHGKFTAAAPTTIVTQQASMSVALGKMIATGFVKAPFDSVPYTLARGPDHQIGGSGAPSYSGLIANDSAWRQWDQDLDREV